MKPVVLQESDPHVVIAIHKDHRIRVVVPYDAHSGRWAIHVYVAYDGGRETILEQLPESARTQEEAVAAGLGFGVAAIDRQLRTVGRSWR
ncbi:hypothetical protein BH11PSE9_BH11PSE9_29740 [soil metagenome]